MTDYSQQYHPVILDLGSRNVTYGFAGEPTPTGTMAYRDLDIQRRELQFSEVKMTKQEANEYLKTLKTDSHDLARIYAGDLQSLQWLWNYDKLRPRLGADGSIIHTDQYLEETHLERSLYALFLYELLIDAKSTKVIILEPHFLPEHVKKRYTYVLLNHLHVQSVTSLPSSILTCLGAGVKSGVVIDFGWEYVTVVPVYDLRVIQDLGISSGRSAKGLHYEILSSILQGKHLTREILTSMSCHQVFQMVEDIVINRTSSAMEGPHIDDLIDRYLFPARNTWKSLDSNEMSVVQLVENMIGLLPFDLKKPLQQNVIITGGLSQVPGLKKKIIEQLGLDYKEVFSLGSWSGGSIYSDNLLRGKNLVRSGELRRNEYLDGKANATDWTSQIYRSAIEKH
ncbi:unnamed protein product [Kuraishia capsulata CBS 1993]|uniref:Actin-like protein ARP6 n=1 Tax=Kuraishia capsulata CBS 1993 TaxID=1382522 RepID=W6MFQ8_9ASCO|nr:uncharacterized protein KUCA_T00000424001 [Kuraishia capsulata CBS 1993]CDK24461.1 unnamed protein product [Kuraishia capsulata CBS 1993]